MYDTLAPTLFVSASHHSLRHYSHHFLKSEHGQEDYDAAAATTVSAALEDIRQALQGVRVVALDRSVAHQIYRDFPTNITNLNRQSISTKGSTGAWLIAQAALHWNLLDEDFLDNLHVFIAPNFLPFLHFLPHAKTTALLSDIP